MTYEEKFDIIVRAIEEARKITPPGYDTKLKITYENRLQELDLDDVTSILYQLQDNHKVIKIVSLATTKTDMEIVGLDPYHDERDYFAIQVPDTFEKWSKSRSSKGKDNHSSEVQNKNIPKHTRKALEKIWNLLQEIEEKRQLGSDGEQIRITRYLSDDKNADKVYEEKKTILEKLQSLNAITGLHKGKVGAFNYWAFKIDHNYQDVFDDHQRRYKKA